MIVSADYSSWGYIFLETLLGASHANDVKADSEARNNYQRDLDDDLDRSFNFRMRGLNADYMNYAMLALANNSKEALLDFDTYVQLANKTFGIFFKHFVSHNDSNAYQPIGEQVPWSLGPVYIGADLADTSAQGALPSNPRSHERPSAFANATLAIPVEQLVMSSISVFLCLSLLVILLIITVTIYSVDRSHAKLLPRDMDNLASVLALVYGSDKLQLWAAQRAPHPRPWYRSLFSRTAAAETQTKARLGAFTSSDGVVRWGVELTGSHDDAGCVETGSHVELIELRPIDTRGIEHVAEDGDVASRTNLLSVHDEEDQSLTGDDVEASRQQLSTPFLVSSMDEDAAQTTAAGESMASSMRGTAPLIHDEP